MVSNKNKSTPPAKPFANSSQLGQQHISIKQQQISIGPIPPPNILEEYEKIYKGFANRIVEMAEEQAAHRQQLEKMTLEANIVNKKEINKAHRRGQIFAFILCILFILVGCFLMYQGKFISGTIFSGAGLAAIIGAFLYPPHEKKQARENHKK